MVNRTDCPTELVVLVICLLQINSFIRSHFRIIRFDLIKAFRQGRNNNAINLVVS